MKGLYKSIYGATDEGIFDVLFSRHGSSPPVKRMDIRLGEYGEDAEEEEVAAPAPAAPAVPAAPAPAPAAPTAPTNGPSSGAFFAQDIGGFPLWLVGVGFLGFAWAFRRKRKKQSSRRR